MSGPRQRGQATVEFALVLPLILVTLLAVLQIVVVAYSQLAVTHTAREIARVLAVDPSADVGLLTDETTLLGTEGLHIEIEFQSSDSGGHELVSVTVTYEIEPISSLFHAFLHDLEVRQKVKMLVER